MSVSLELFIVVHSSADIRKAEDILYKHHDNFIVKGALEGNWKGSPEEMLWVVVVDLELAIYDTVRELKQELDLDYLPIGDEGNVKEW